MHATSSPTFADQKPAALAALAAILFAAGIALGAASDLDLRIAPTAASIAAPDTSYDAVEGVRAQFGAAPDTSYDTVESIRAQSGVTVDTSLKGRSGYPSTRGDGRSDVVMSHDQARAAGGWWASAPTGAPVSQPESNGRYGPGIR